MKKTTALLTALVAMIAILIAWNIRQTDQSVFAFGEEKAVYLTFDDGPSNRVTPKVLDVLKEKKVPATFFIIGCQAETRGELLRRIYDEGHTIALHSYTHDYKQVYASKQALLSDVEKCREVIERETGVSPKLYRFPGGSSRLSDDLKNAIREKGYTYVDWNASMRDAELSCPTVSQLVDAATEPIGVRNRVVLLCHDGTFARKTAQALPVVIDRYREAGYSFHQF
ncbi:MAG: polysaccharide deacetylase family protein [Christensenellaceae bacterium]